MQLRFFTIPVVSSDSDDESLNKFLRSVKVLEIKKELVSVGSGVFWAICIMYLPIATSENFGALPKGKVDYKVILSEVEFKQFCLLRKIRKQLADEDAVPAFAVFTDHELAEISKLEDITSVTIKGINGIGEKKIAKYGNKLCEMLIKNKKHEADGLFD